MYVNDLIDDVRDGDKDDVKKNVANKLPVRVVTELIAVPASDREMIFGWAEQIAGHSSLDSASLHGTREANENLKGYEHELIVDLRIVGGTETALARVDVQRR